MNTTTDDYFNAFTMDPWWPIVFAKVLGLFILLVLIVLITIWAERRVVGRMQMRIGPNRVGPLGLLQSLMDGVKLAFKEEIFPTAADKFVYILAPILATIPAFLAWAVIPLGPMVWMFGYQTPLQLTDFPVSVLYIVAIASIGIYGIVLAGWSSGSTYALLGGLRSSAQMISYEVAMGLSFVAVFLYAGSASTSQIVAAQEKTWYIILLLPSFLIYVTAMVGETNRAPFDLPEAEGELVGGFHTEYSTLKFAVFFLAEYINLVTVSALATTLFLGGWRAPYPISLWAGANEGWWPLVWFLGKLCGFIFVFIWLRGTLPRLRYDQFMKFGWKFLMPVSLVWILIVGFARAMRNDYNWDLRQTVIVIAVPIIAILIVMYIIESIRERRADAAVAEEEEARTEFDPMAGGFPVPPMPGQSYTPTRRSKATVGVTALPVSTDAEIEEA
ncbi:MAG: NADH-quinone oxidoreductase subunit NuoH [Actinobacteria bacterium]|nr:NADH-quinone oxidoreductase subunit NuoH [Actinomycetota bacterium]